MSDLYRSQRASLLAINPRYEALLPDHPPDAPPVDRIGLVGARKILGPAANNHAAVVFVIGWGDGALLKWMAEDPLLRQKQIFVVLLKGEEAAFAATFAREPALLPILQSLDPKVNHIISETEIAALCADHFCHHHDITRLAGCDVIDTHPLCLAGEASRRELTPLILKRLSDRPQMYGNDILDSFTGLLNGAANAPTILPAPTLGECWGMLGNTPVISIAGGPSLRRHIPLLRELQDRCLLIACDSVLPGLLKEGIEPHLATPLERLPATVDLVQAARGTRTIFAGSCVVPPGAVEAFSGRAVGVYAGDQLYNWFLPEPGRRVNTGSSTGVFTVPVGAAFTTGPIYLVGHDLARERDQSHWEGASYSSGLWAQVKNRVATNARAATGYEDRLIPGNNGGQVPSIAWWDRFRVELASEAADLVNGGRVVYNVNAHDRIGAVIDNTVGAPLPDPASLPKLGPLTLPPQRPERLADWRLRAQRLPEDAAAFRSHLGVLRQDLVAARELPPDRWPIDALSNRLTLTSGISEGNRWAFFYFLRSALHNTTADMHRRRRTPSTARYRWLVMDSMDSLCHALDNAVENLTPKLEEVARGCHL